jgi:GNAT superfamily N-acetyltransferase
MFVAPDFRGSRAGTAQRLLDALIAWCATRRLRDVFLGTTPHFLAAHRFYQKNGFREIPKSALPASFPLMEVDTRFFHRHADGGASG